MGRALAPGGYDAVSHIVYDQSMDTVDELARKLISAFEELEEEIVPEQLAVPEDLADNEGSVDLWVATAETCDLGEELVVRARVSVPTAVALQWDADELGRLFREELLNSEQFRQATRVAGVACRAAEERGVPSPEEAEQN